MQNWEEWIKYKKIVFFVAETVPSPAGSGINAFRYAKFLSKYSKNVKIVCFNYNNTLRKSEIIDEVNIKRIPYYNRNIFSKTLSLPLLLFHYIKETLKCNICLIYGAYMPGYEIVLMVGWLYSKYIIFQSTLLHDDDISSILKRPPLFLKPIKKFLFSQIKIYYAINESFANIWKEKINSKVPIVLRSQGIDIANFSLINNNNVNYYKKEFHIPDNIFIILSVGILIKRKGYIETFSALQKIKSPFIYVIAGLDAPDLYHRSSESEILEMQQIKETGKKLLGDKVRFLGHINDLHRLYRIADVFIHAATKEGTPGAILEAMINKVPVILRELEGTDLLFKNEENCLIFKDPHEIRTCINRIHSEIKLSKVLSENAYESVKNNETFEKISEQIFNYCL